MVFQSHPMRSFLLRGCAALLCFQLVLSVPNGTADCLAPRSPYGEGSQPISAYNTEQSKDHDLEYLDQLPPAMILGKTFLVRVDYNDQHWDDAGKLVDDRRFQASLPTIRHITRNGGKVILLTHQGRPQGRVVKNLKLTRVAKGISALLQCPVPLLESSQGRGKYQLIQKNTRERVKAMQPGEVVMLDNARFDPRDQSKISEERASLAKDLAELADYFVLDGFPISHRDEASVTEIAKLLPGVKGFWIKEEEHFHHVFLNRLKDPYRGKLVAIFGGIKSDKFPLVARLLPRMRKGDRIELAGTLHIDIPQDMRDLIARCGIELVEPDDVVGNNLDIGPKTVEKFRGALGQAELVIWNGPLPPCQHGMRHSALVNY